MCSALQCFQELQYALCSTIAVPDIQSPLAGMPMVECDGTKLERPPAALAMRVTARGESFEVAIARRASLIAGTCGRTLVPSRRTLQWFYYVLSP